MNNKSSLVPPDGFRPMTDAEIGKWHTYEQKPDWAVSGPEQKMAIPTARKKVNPIPAPCRKDPCCR